MHIELKGKLLWHVNIVSSRNGQVVLTSETYFSKSNAQRAAKRAAKALKLEIR